MAIMTYQTLVDQIKVYANRTDDKFLNQIPNFIDQAMERIYSQGKNLGFQQTLSNVNQATTVRANQYYMAIPDDWIETITIQIQPVDGGNNPIGSLVTLLPQEYEYVTTIYPDVTVTAMPKYYAVTDDFNVMPNPQGQMVIYYGPTADADYYTYHTYLARPNFTNAGDTNYLTARYRRALLYGALLEAQPFLKDDERIAAIEKLYENALATLMKDKVSRYDDQSVRRDKS